MKLVMQDISLRETFYGTFWVKIRDTFRVFLGKTEYDDSDNRIMDKLGILEILAFNIVNTILNINKKLGSIFNESQSKFRYLLLAPTFLLFIVCVTLQTALLLTSIALTIALSPIVLLVHMISSGYKGILEKRIDNAIIRAKGEEITIKTYRESYGVGSRKYLSFLSIEEWTDHRFVIKKDDGERVYEDLYAARSQPEAYHACKLLGFFSVYEQRKNAAFKSRVDRPMDDDNYSSAYFGSDL